MTIHLEYYNYAFPSENFGKVVVAKLQQIETGNTAADRNWKHATKSTKTKCALPTLIGAVPARILGPVRAPKILVYLNL